MYGVNQPQGGQLDITTSFNPMQIFLHGSMCTIEINQQPTYRPWGRHVIDLWPGVYLVRVYFKYLFTSQAGLGAVQVHIHPGYATMVRYDTPTFVTSSGNIQILGQRPMGAWY